MNIDDEITIDSTPSEELTALAFTILNGALETPELAKQLEPFEWHVLIVDNLKRETGKASQTFNPPEDVLIDPTFWALARSMMLQCRDIATISKIDPELHQVALGLVSELLEVLTRGGER